MPDLHSGATAAERQLNAEETPEPKIIARHREMLVVAAVISIAALLLEVLPDGRVAVVGLRDYPFPHTCMSRTVFGVRCPGCGLTRSLVYFAHGDLKSSYEVHRLGWLFGALVLLQFPLRAIALLGRNPYPIGKRVPRFIGYALIALLIGNWLLGMA